MTKASVMIEDGQVIDQDGSYRMSMEWYHSQCCDGPSVSSSGLRKIYHSSPADFWAFADLNDRRFPSPSKDAFTYGRAAHSLVLGDEDFHANFAVVPEDAPSKPTSAQVSARNQGRVSDVAQERFAFWDAFEAESEGKEWLSEADLRHIMHIAERLSESPVMQVVLDGQREQSLIWKDEPSGIWLKSRLDVLSATGDLADFKTTRMDTVPRMLRDVRTKGYDMQLGLATMGLEQIMGVEFSSESYAARSAILIHVTKSPPYHVVPIEVSFDALHYGRLKCRKAIDTMRECMVSGVWPGLTEVIEVYSSDYEATDLEEKIAAGTLPAFV